MVKRANNMATNRSKVKLKEHNTTDQEKNIFWNLNLHTKTSYGIKYCEIQTIIKEKLTI